MNLCFLRIQIAGVFLCDCNIMSIQESKHHPRILARFIVFSYVQQPSLYPNLRHRGEWAVASAPCAGSISIEGGGVFPIQRFIFVDVNHINFLFWGYIDLFNVGRVREVYFVSIAVFRVFGTNFLPSSLSPPILLLWTFIWSQWSVYRVISLFVILHRYLKNIHYKERSSDGRLSTFNFSCRGIWFEARWLLLFFFSFVDIKTRLYKELWSTTIRCPTIPNICSVSQRFCRRILSS